jgi:site-specific DNA recombinase
VKTSIARRQNHINELHKRASEADVKLIRLYEAVRNSIADLKDFILKKRVAGAIDAPMPSSRKIR